MSVSREVPSDGKAVVPLRVDYVTDSQTTSTSIVYCTDTEGTQIRVALREPSVADLSLETDKWYRFDGTVRSNSLDAELLLPAEDSDVEHLDTPPRQAHPPLNELEAPWLVQLGASDEHIAVTVHPRSTESATSIRVEDPETFEIGAVCLAHCDGSGDTTVYHREESNTHDEHLLLEHVVDDLSAAAQATLVTRGNNHNPLGMLYQRLALAAEGDIIDTNAEEVLEECFHANVERLAVRMGAETLTEVASQVGIDEPPILLTGYDIGRNPADWREDWEIDSTTLSDVSDPQMVDRDYATLVEWYLDDEDESGNPEQLARCLKDYASADLRLFRELATNGTMEQLGCPRATSRLFA